VQKIIDLAHSEIAQIKAVKPPAQFAAGQRAVVADLNTVFGGLQSLLSKPITATTFAAALRSPAVLHAAQDYVARSRAAGLPSCVLTNGA
jgi:small basic protein